MRYRSKQLSRGSPQPDPSYHALESGIRMKRNDAGESWPTKVMESRSIRRPFRCYRIHIKSGSVHASRPHGLSIFNLRSSTLLYNRLAGNMKHGLTQLLDHRSARMRHTILAVHHPRSTGHIP